MRYCQISEALLERLTQFLERQRVKEYLSYLVQLPSGEQELVGTYVPLMVGNLVVLPDGTRWRVVLVDQKFANNRMCQNPVAHVEPWE